MRRFPGILVVFLVLLAAAAAIAADDEMLFKAGGKTLYRADLERIIGYYAPDKRSLFEQPTYKSSLLTRIVQATLISEVARKEGFDKDSAIKEQIDLLVNDFLATQYLKQVVLKNVTVSDEDAQLYYKTHRSEFAHPEMVRVRHILVKVDGTTEDDKKKALAKAEAIMQRLKAGEDFAKLAEAASDDAASKSRGGDLGLLPKERLAPEFAEVAFALKTGELGGPVLTRYGYHIVRLDEKKPASTDTFDQVRDRVRKQVMDDLNKARVTEFLDKVFKESGAEVHPERLAGPAK